MKCSLASATLLAASAPLALAACQKSPLGNYYCDPVRAITFTNFGFSGKYNKVTGMDSNTGQCTSTPESYSGGMAPLDQEVSWHFRGPMNLKQFAYYTPGSLSKRDTVSPPIERRHGHHHDFLHERSSEAREAEKRALGDMVTAQINGVWVTWQNSYDGGAAAAATNAPAAANKAPATASNAPADTFKPIAAPSGSWSRQSYYNAGNGTSQNLAFLNNMGGQASGIFDNKFGLSLSYASSDGSSAASSSQILNDAMLGDGVELALFSGKQCSGSDCGFYRPGTVAYHGFGGPTKMFLLEFEMPMTGGVGFNKDMPAAWILNALIPRTLQYGQETCSCWISGCGEWDIFEVLESGRQECIATFHGGKSVGESDYFQRPTSGTMKAVVMMDGGSKSGSIVAVDEATSFDMVLSGDVVQKLLGMGGTAKVAALPS